MFKNKHLTILETLYVLLVFACFIPAALYAAEGETWIVFECNRPNPNATEASYWDIWKLDPDGPGTEGSDLFGIPLTTDPANEWDPTYSVEDEAVVFVSDKSGWPNLWKVSIDGGYPSGLVFGQYCAVDPCYSFDGTKIAYASNQTGNWEIYTMDADGGNKTNITNYSAADDRSPCFSKDGLKVYFISNRDEAEIGDWEIYVVNTGGGTATKAILDGNNQPLLLDYTEHDPCCSPSDDDIIVFATNLATSTYTDPGLIDEADRINFELFKYSIANKSITRLTESWNEYQGSKGPVAELWNSSMPCFSPDGERIAWSADNWTGVSWQPLNFPDGPYEPSYWKPNGGQGSVHQIWTRRLDQPDHHYWFPPSYWGWNPDYDPPQPWPWGPPGPGHQHHKHYNPSWDEQP